MTEKRVSNMGRRKADRSRFLEMERTIKELDRTQKKLLENEKRLLRAQRMALIGDWDMDLHSLMQRWSDPLFEIYGLPRSDSVPYDTFKSCIHPDDLEKVVENREMRIAEGKPFSYEFRIVRSDGEVRHIRAEMDFEYDENGEAIRIVGTNQDITERKLIEIENWESKVRAENAAAAKNDSLAQMSHELRTPLNAILGFSGAMSEQVFGPVGNETYLDYINDINVSGKHLLELINDILDLSVIEAGKLDLYPEPLNMADLIETSINFLSHRAQEEKVDITTDIATPVPIIQADHRRARQILLNLLSNAVKFTPSGGSVCVSVRQDSDDTLILSVKDTGLGMSEHEIVMAMTPFKHGNPRVTKSDEGTGLGLPLTESLIKAHGGSLHIDSCPGEGTTITVRFPL